MGADIKTLRTRIKSVDSTLHLTKAMGLVASSKLRRAMESMNRGREYERAVRHAIEPLLASMECKNSPYMRTSGERVIRRKGATYYAVSLAVCHICKCIFYSTETLLTVSTMLHGEFGISDVCLSLMTEVGKNGHGNIFPSPMTDEEIAKLAHSAETLKTIIKNVGL